MALVIGQVVRKFGNYNVGEKVSETESQIALWNKLAGDAGPVVVIIPPAVPAPNLAKAEMAPPLHKQVVAPDEAKGDEMPGGRGRR